MFVSEARQAISGLRTHSSRFTLHIVAGIAHPKTCFKLVEAGFLLIATFLLTSCGAVVVRSSSTEAPSPMVASTVVWATPAPINYGTPLGAAQLDASASVSGTFLYSPAADTVLNSGSQTLSVTFTPTNTVDYDSATASVKLIVNKPAPTIAAGTILGTWPIASGAEPLGIVTDSGGNAIVADHLLKSISKRSPTGSLLWTTSVEGGTEAIAVDASDNVWTSGYNQAFNGTFYITEVSPAGSVVGNYPIISLSPFMDGSLAEGGACGLAFDLSGNLWMTVVQSTTDVVEEMSPTGVVLASFTNSQFGCSSPAVDPQGHVWVPGYRSSQTLTELGPSGTVLNTFSFASGSNPETVVFDSQGNMWVALSGTQQVEKLTPAGAVLAIVSTDTAGSGLGPNGIAVDGEDNLWVAGHRSAFVWELSSSGVIQGSWPDGGVADSIAIDPSGNVWVDNALVPSLTKIQGSV